MREDKMSYKTVSDYPDSEVEPLNELKHELAKRAGHHAIRSVRLTVSRRYDVPALRIESQHRSLNNSVRDAMDEAGVEILTPFSTEDHGNQVAIVGFRD